MAANAVSDRRFEQLTDFFLSDILWLTESDVETCLWEIVPHNNGSIELTT
jgi:hypothetical protein